ncbi:MAG: phosphoglycerate kinase [Acidobacteria bacterium]|nr:MAG: phosphoglycerate kinase [Acidobacteriota bacterium]
MSYELYRIEDLTRAGLHGRCVFVRVDFNVPMQGSRVLDDTRIRESLPTLQTLREAGARLLVASHRGRPKGRVVPELSLEPLLPAFGAALGTSVGFVAECAGEAVRAAAEALEPGAVCLLENLRFHAGEEAGDDDFARRLAEPCDVYVGEAFGTAHRAHASISGVPRHTEHRAAGKLMVREAEVLGGLLEAPERPYAALLGGAKVSGKIDTLQRLIEDVDLLLIGGGMANPFLAAQGHRLAASLVEQDRIEIASRILQRCDERGVQVLLPVDLRVTRDLEDPTQGLRTVSVAAGDDRLFDLEAGELAADIGDRTAQRFAAALEEAATVFWNGPMGVFETPPFDQGSRAVAEAVARCGGFSVIGGGETVAAAAAAGVLDRIGHVSTGGGASLALLAGKPMPGLEALLRELPSPSKPEEET